MSQAEDPNEILETEAARWFTLMHSGEVSQGDRKRFEAWLHGKRAHKIAYREIEQVYRDLDYVLPEAGIDLNVMLQRNSRGWRSLVDMWRAKSWLAAGMAVASVLFVLVALNVSVSAPTEPFQGPSSPQYVTEIAEIKELVLEDGSTVTLGAKTQIETIFTPTRRQVTLLDGEAFFDVAKDESRPFFVVAQDTLVRVVGTKFDVKRSAEIVHVSVLEGVVEVMKSNDVSDAIKSDDDPQIDKQVLTAGERVSAARRVALPKARQVEQVEPGAWRKGRLAYEDASLAEIVSDLNRYSETVVRIESSDLGDLRSTIAFNTADVDIVFEVMTAIHPIRIDLQENGEILIRSAS